MVTIISFCTNIDYNISTKGKYKMNKFQQLNQLMKQNNDMLCTKQVVAAGISKPIFYQFVQEYELKQVAHGIYLSKDAWVDFAYILHLRCAQAIFSHETALFFHNLTDREPLNYTITVKTGYNPSRLKKDDVRVYTIKEELHEVGITNVNTIFEHTIPVYDLERTICDVLRSRSQIEKDILFQAIKGYICRQDKDLFKLMNYAKLFKVDNILRQYLEVLL